MPLDDSESEEEEELEEEENEDMESDLEEKKDEGKNKIISLYPGFCLLFGGTCLFNCSCFSQTFLMNWRGARRRRCSTTLIT